MLSEIEAPITQVEPVKPKDFTDIIRDRENTQRFIDLLGPRAMSYIQSVILLYRSEEKLHVCTPTSIVSAALRSASCELQVDPLYRQAYLVPRPRKIKARKGVSEHYVTEANFQPHYHGLEVLAHRTNLYRAINVSPIYKGQRVLEDIHTGLHYFTVADADGREVERENGDPLLAVPARVSQLRDATMGRRSIEDVIGYLAYFETFKGQKKTEWMTIQEIEAHAKKWSDAYTSPYSLWSPNSPHRPVMQMKTCFIRLTKSMDLFGHEHEMLLKAVTAGDEAQQAALEAAGLEDGEISPNEPQYQTDEFSQEPAPAIVINTASVTTAGPAQGATPKTQPDTRKTAEPLPTVARVGIPLPSYDNAKRYFLGPKMLESIQTSELEAALERNLASSTKKAIQVVLEWRKVNTIGQ